MGAIRGPQGVQRAPMPADFYSSWVPRKVLFRLPQEEQEMAPDFSLPFALRGDPRYAPGSARLPSVYLLSPILFKVRRHSWCRAALSGAVWPPALAPEVVSISGACWRLALPPSRLRCLFPLSPARARGRRVLLPFVCETKRKKSPWPSGKAA